MAATVTRLARARRQGWVAVELDGSSWRVLPDEAVGKAGLCVGEELSRLQARVLRRELRRIEALSKAAATLERATVSQRRLEERLARSGVAPRQRGQTIEMLSSLGLVNDLSFARRRATALAARGAGDLKIRVDLGHWGLERAVADQAIGELMPEAERALGEADRRGLDPQTLRYLGRQGFADESLEPLREALFAERLENP